MLFVKAALANRNYLVSAHFYNLFFKTYLNQKKARITAGSIILIPGMMVLHQDVWMAVHILLNSVVILGIGNKEK